MNFPHKPIRLFAGVLSVLAVASLSQVSQATGLIGKEDLAGPWAITRMRYIHQPRNRYSRCQWNGLGDSAITFFRMRQHSFDRKIPGPDHEQQRQRYGQLDLQQPSRLRLDLQDPSGSRPHRVQPRGHHGRGKQLSRGRSHSSMMRRGAVPGTPGPPQAGAESVTVRSSRRP